MEVWQGAVHAWLLQEYNWWPHWGFLQDVRQVCILPKDMGYIRDNHSYNKQVFLEHSKHSHPIILLLTLEELVTWTITLPMMVPRKDGSFSGCSFPKGRLID